MECGASRVVTCGAFPDAVIPAKAGIQAVTSSESSRHSSESWNPLLRWGKRSSSEKRKVKMDSSFRWNDGEVWR